MKLFVLTGAGCSAESGLGTFRDVDGIWKRFDPLKLATPQAFARKPDEVHAFYNARRRNLQAAEPNTAHFALVRLEAELAAKSSELFLCTQNVDDLHERAGMRQVTHMHGELLKARCVHCEISTLWHNDLGREDICPSCGIAASLRPDVVWFGEMPLHMDAIHHELHSADMFVAIGTSGSVYPAAGFVEEARRKGIKTCEINIAPSDNAHLFDEAFYGPATEAVPDWVERVLSGM